MIADFGLEQAGRLDAELLGIERLAVPRLGEGVDLLEFRVARQRELLHVLAAIRPHGPGESRRKRQRQENPSVRHSRKTPFPLRIRSGRAAFTAQKAEDKGESAAGPTFPARASELYPLP